MDKIECQKMASYVISNHVEHYHGSVKIGDSKQILDNYKGKKGFFMKKFLINDTFNLNNWKVTWDAIQKDAHEFIGKPVVLTPDRDHPRVMEQEDYRIGEIIDVQLDPVKRTAYSISQIYDEKAQKMIENEEIEFGSPMVMVRTPQTREQKFKGTDQQQDILHRFKPAHDALVADPAYGKERDNIHAICKGDGETCGFKLLQASKGKTKEQVNQPKSMSEYEAKPYPWDQCIRDQMKEYGNETTAKKVCGMIKAKYGSYNEKIASEFNSSVDKKDLEAAIGDSNTSQISIVPFVKTKLSAAYTAEQVNDIVGKIEEAEEEVAEQHRRINKITDTVRALEQKLTPPKI